MDSSNTIYASFNTLKEMLKDQDCDISNIEHLSKDELTSLQKEGDHMFQIEVSNTMKIVYYLNNKFKVSDLRKYLQPVDDRVFTDIVLVFKEKINNFNPKNVDELNNVNLQIFMIKELMYNISKHVLVPKHEAIRDSDAIVDIVATYSLKSKLQFPIILKTDPMVRYLNVQPGQLVKITRNSPSCGDNILYRCCV
jgi:DNA-directed RNA polymerase I, II, and III subunit RPABC1